MVEIPDAPDFGLRRAYGLQACTCVRAIAVCDTHLPYKPHPLKPTSMDLLDTSAESHMMESHLRLEKEK